MTPLKCIVVDDEPIARAIVENYISQIPYLERIASCKNAFEAMETITATPVDLIVLDINMPRLTGLEMLKSIKSYPSVIITSAYPQYALEGFELSVTDYLLKPFSFARFVQATEKLIKPKTNPPVGAGHHRTEPGIPSPEFITVRSDKKLIRVAFNRISFVEAYGNYIFIHQNLEKIISRQTLSQFESLLPGGKFIRVHKSFIVALAAIVQLDGNELTVGKAKIPVGKVFKDELISRLL